MTADDGDDGGILAKVDLMSALLSARDLRLVDELWSPGFRLVGSEPGEVAETRDQLVRLFTRLFSRPVRYRFDFPAAAVNRSGDVAWLFAEGDLLATADDGTVRRLPYRLTAVFQAVDGAWRWRLFSGSEPAPPGG